MAIPFFILAGNLMTAGGISQRIVHFTNSVVGKVRGGMAVACVAGCAFFAALSGSSPATVIAIGSMLYPEMVEMGYPKHEAAGLIAVSGGLGPIIPPSIIMVVYATTVGCSVTEMFVAGATCGIFIAIALAVVTIFIAYKKGYPRNEKRYTFKSWMKILYQAFPALILPFIIIGGIVSGLFTPTESAVVSVIYAMIVALFIYKSIKFRDLWKVFLDSAKASAIVLFIMGTSSAFAWIFTSSGISSSLVQAIAAMNLSKGLFLVMVAVILLIFGTFMEGVATTLLLIPVFLPIANSFGIHPVHLGMIMSISTVVGGVTPPVALNIFAASSFTKLRLEDISRGEIPWLITLTAAFLVIVFVPGLSLLLIG